MCVNGDNMDEQMDKKEKVTTSNRRNNKPLMEKRRRQRINECLNQLKSLVLQAMNKDTTQYSKLEKADILEMTVKHLKVVQRQQMSAAMANDPNVISKYRAGFNECAAEISRYLDSVNQSNPELKARIMNYLASSMMQFPVIPVYQSMTSPYQFPMSPQVPSHHSFVSQFCQDSGHLMGKSGYVPRKDAQYQHSQPSSDVRTLRVPVCVDQSSRATTSPVRRVPSPCDSDSGLSDSSLSISHDENGNYSEFNINHAKSTHGIKTESCGQLTNREYGSDVEYGQVDRKIPSSRRSRIFTEDTTSPKRQRTLDNTYQLEPSNMVNQIPVSENMWRPW